MNRKPNNPPATRPSDVAKIAVESWDGIRSHESFKIMLLDSDRNVLGIRTVAVGGTASATIDVRLCLRAAVLENVTTVIALHNHPACRMWPSKDDEYMTGELKRAFANVGVTMIDHVIVGGNGEFYSFADNDMM